MKTFLGWSSGALCGAILLAQSAAAFPNIDSALVTLRVFNDDTNSVASFVNNYPSVISISDTQVDGDGVPGEFANRHNFRLSDNGGANPALFLNGDGFAVSADVTITGTANAEGGLNISPWWSLDVDGNFMINTGSGEVAIFGGRLPFYSFTANHGRTYTRGTTVRLGATYDPNSLTQADPATIQYSYTDGSGTYLSPLIPFDEGNPNEDPPHGRWGLLNPFAVGGYFQVPIAAGNPENGAEIRWGNISYVPEPASVLLLLAAGALLRRR